MPDPGLERRPEVPLGVPERRPVRGSPLSGRSAPIVHSRWPRVWGGGHALQVPDPTVEAVALALAVATTPPRSMEEFHQLEARLIELDHDLAGYEDFETAVACFHPGGGDQLIDERGLQSAARDFLHELGHHSLCLHDVPLGDRP